MVVILISAALLSIVLGSWIQAIWIEISLRRRVWITKTEGTVVGGRSWGETYVSGSSSGGGGYIGPYGGHIESPKLSVTSEVSDAHQFFVRPHDGSREIPVTIRPGSAFPTREGHHVILLHLHSKKAMQLWGARNLQTGKTFWYDPQKFAQSQMLWPWLLGILLLSVLVAFVGSVGGAATYGVAAYSGHAKNLDHVNLGELWFVGVIAGFVALLVLAKLVDSVGISTASRALKRKLREAGGL